MKQQKQHPNSLKNIEGHKWKKGQSGNPSGKPKQVITPLLLKALKSKKVGKMEFPGGRTFQDVILESITRAIIEGNSAVIRELWDRFDGKQMPESALMTEGNPVGMAIKEALMAIGNLAVSQTDGPDS